MSLLEYDHQQAQTTAHDESSFHMTTPKIAKIQHYVPQLILKNFSSGKKSQVFVFDKRRETVFKAHVKNVAAEQGFYNFDLEGSTYTIELGLSHIEEITSRVIKKIIDEESLANITDDERLTLSVFIAIQLARTKQARLNIEAFNKSIAETIRKMGFDPSQVEGFNLMDTEEVKQLSIQVVMNSSEYVPFIYDKAWLLFKTPKSMPFYISDNPVTLQNMLDFGLRGNLGLAVKGIEIYFPISNTLSLGIFCRSYEQVLQDSYQEYQWNLRGLPHELASVLKRQVPQQVEQLMAGLNSGQPVPSSRENVTHHNALQVRHSTRFVYSSLDNFALAREILKQYPELKQGAGIQIG